MYKIESASIFFPLLFIVFGDNVPYTLEKVGGGAEKKNKLKLPSLVYMTPRHYLEGCN